MGFYKYYPETPGKKYFKLSGLSVLLSIISFIAFGLLLDSESPTKNNSAALSVQNSSDEYVNQELPAKVSDLPQEPKQEEAKTADTKPTIIKSGTYNISGESFSFSNSVINDVTGKWRLSLIASSKDVTEYAVDYYNTLFSSDDEIHAIVNFTLKTTTCISVLYDGMLDITIHEYVDKEEHDANALFSGMLLKEYFIDIETGVIEEIQ